MFPLFAICAALFPSLRRTASSSPASLWQALCTHCPSRLLCPCYLCIAVAYARSRALCIHYAAPMLALSSLPGPSPPDTGCSIIPHWTGHYWFLGCRPRSEARVNHPMCKPPQPPLPQVAESLVAGNAAVLSLVNPRLGFHGTLRGAWSLRGDPSKVPTKMKKKLIAGKYIPKYIRVYVGVYLPSVSHSHHHLSCRPLQSPGIFHRHVVPSLINPFGPTAASGGPHHDRGPRGTAMPAKQALGASASARR